MDIVQEIYKLRQTFVIIGLTGRTGSGCTTVANLIKGGFDELDVSPTYNNEGVSNDERKYRIEYNFLKTIWEDKKFEFKVITASDIIFFYALQEDFKNIIKDITYKIEKSGITTNVSDENNIRYSLNLSEDEYKKLEDEYKTIHDYVFNLNNFLEGKKRNNENKTKVDKEELKKYIDFFDNRLPEFREKFFMHSRLSKGDITKLFQKWGNNVRKYGSVLEKENETVPSMLAHTINRIIKMIRKYNNKSNTNGSDKPTFVIIDSLRNPYEVLYFRERYTAFYLVSINTTEETRKNNLYAKKFYQDEISELDDKEYPSKRKDIVPSYYSQDVEKCVELSDIHIAHHNKPELDNTDADKDLKRQIIHFLSLILHPGLVQPTPQERIMQIAYTTKFNSGCISRQVGAVVTDADYSVKSIGWNSVAKGQTPCSLRCLFDLYKHEDASAFSEYEMEDKDFRNIVEKYCEKYIKVYMDNHAGQKKKVDFKTIEKSLLNGLPLSFCFKDFYTVHNNGQKNQVHTRSLHAEENAFLQLAKYGSMGIEGGYLFTTASCCELCAKKAYQLGIKRIYYIDIYPGISIKHILKSGNRKDEIEIIQFQGIIGRAYEALYSPFFPMKDEIGELTQIKVESEEKERKNSKVIKTIDQTYTNDNMGGKIGNKSESIKKHKLKDIFVRHWWKNKKKIIR